MPFAELGRSIGSAPAPFALVEQHVDAVRAIIREAKLKDADKTATELVARLRQVTDDFLAHENRHRPDYLDGILAYFDTKLTSGAIEAVNGIIQLAKRMARGFRNFVYFRTAAYHRAGQLNLTAIP